MNEMEILQGTVSNVLFQNYDNGYAVVRLECDNGQTVTVVGTIPLPFIGEQLMVTGKWSTHASYGRQFEAEFLERLLPQTETQILSYLSGRAVKGIGPKLAAAIVHRFGADTLNILEASLLAMRRAIDGLSVPADFALIDGNVSRDFQLPNALPKSPVYPVKKQF